MKRTFTYSLFILLILSACNNKNKSVNEDDIPIDYNELLKDIEPKENKKNKKNQNLMDDGLCDINYLNEINKDIKELSYLEIETYLLSFNNSCKNNAEYLQYNNETLFNLLITQPVLVLEVLAKNKKVKKEIVLEEISNPISDMIDLDKLISKIEKTNISTIEKNRIIEALKNAKN